LLSDKLDAHHRQGKSINLDVLRRQIEHMGSLDFVPSLVESSIFRRQLIEISSEIGAHDHPDLRQALAKDEAEIIHMIRRVLSSDFHQRTVLDLRGEEAERFMELLRLVTKDRSLSDDLPFFQKARRLRQKLSNACHLMPSTIFIRGVQIVDRDALLCGGFADIFKASYNGLDVALKRLRVTEATKGNHKLQAVLYREALLWEDLKHPYVLPFLGMDSETFPSYFPCIVTPWMRHGTILDHIQDNVPRNASLDPLILEIAQGLAYLHSRAVIHGDLRGLNILIDDEWHVRLADFGLASFAESTLATDTSNHHGAKRWMAPELLDPEMLDLKRFQRTPKSDIYAFACVCLELYTGKHPFSVIAREEPVMLSVMNGKRPSRPLDKDRALSDELWDIVQKCWAQSFSERPDMNEVLDMMKTANLGAP